jgi:hypothetical protein
MALATGCTDADAPVRIMQNQAPLTGCTFSQNESTDFITRGRIDTMSTEGYIFLATVKNFAEVSDNVSESQRIAFVEGANVDHSFPEGLFSEEELTGLNDSGIANFSTRFSGSVTPSGGTATFQFVPLPKELLDAIGAKITDQTVSVRMDIQIFGDLGGGGFDSDVFSYWVDVCKDCMQVSVGTCASLAQDFEASTGGECNPLQDVQTQCCTEADNSLTCPATPPVNPEM